MLDWYLISIWIGKLVLSAILGGAIGFERESHGQAAGLRTNVMVGIGSCLLMMLSLHMVDIFPSYDANSSIRLDPGRIASYAVAGMGFLGGGAIIKGKGTVRGLTTAAGLWMVTGIGLAVGAGYIIPAVTTTAISLLILCNLSSLKFVVPHNTYTILTFTCQGSPTPLKFAKKVLGEYPGIQIRFVNYEKDMKSGATTYRIRLSSKENFPWGRIVTRLSQQIPGLTRLAWEEGDVP